MRKIQLIIPVILTLSGCGLSGTPDCSSDAAKDLVLDITKEEMEAMWGADAAESIDFGLESIRTQERNEDVDSYRCAATLTMSRPSHGSETAPIEYTVESTDQSDEIYVEVFGL